MDIDGCITGLGQIIDFPDGKIPNGDDVRHFINSSDRGRRQRHDLVAEYTLSWMLGKMDQIK